MLFLVPSEPCSLEVASITSSTVTLQWTSPETPNGVITKYSIQYNGSVIDNFGSKALNMLMGAFEGLSPDTEYVLQLRGHTRVGPGSPASLTVKTSKLINTTVKDFALCFPCKILVRMLHDSDP